MDKKYSILYVDDEDSNLHIFKNTFRREYEIYTAISAKQGLEILDNEKIDLILTDQRMPEMDGVEFLKNALNKHPDLNRILVTAYTDFDAIKNAINEAQIFQYIQKPWTEENLRSVIEQGLEVYRLRKENEELTKELKIKNQQLEKINDDLIEFEGLKSDFLSIISHEIRTPLNGLVGPLKLLKEELKIESGSVDSLFYVLENSVQKLEHFSIAALNITLLKAKKYRLNIEKVDLPTIIKNTTNLLKENIDQKKIKFTQELDSSFVKVDEELFKICTKGLIDNAIKYSYDSGTIMLKSYANDEYTVFEVLDNGHGFDDKYLDHYLFDYFIFSDEVKSRSIGLGLALIKLIMDAHSGKIEINKNDSSSGSSVKLYFRNI